MSRFSDFFTGLTSRQKIAGGVAITTLLFSCFCCCPGVTWLGIDLNNKREKAAAEAKQKDAEKAIKAAISNVFGIEKNDVNPPIKYASFGEPTDIDGIRFELIGGTSGKVEYSIRSFGGTSKSIKIFTKKNYFQARVRVTNSTKEFILDYEPWHAHMPLRSHSAFKDNFGNNYPAWVSGSSSLMQSESISEYTRLLPGKSLVDTIAFEEPLETSTEFTIELPAENIRRKGVIAYKVPRSFFSK